MSDNALVSFGTAIKRPSELVSARIGDVVSAIADGQWAKQVDRVRKLKPGSSEQKAMKATLPYWTPAGLFRYRSNEGLIKHSGHIAIDLDNLGLRRATKTIQIAVSDQHCRCAFRSVSAGGVRLIFECPPCSAEIHKRVFARVAGHVRERYGIEPDTGSDVSRASFVSFDRGLWLNPSAIMLAGLVELVPSTTTVADGTTHKDSLCVIGLACLSDGDRNTLAYGLGESRAPYRLKDDGTYYTHESLMTLARDLVVRYRRHGMALTAAEIERAFIAWWKTGIRGGKRFRQGEDDYRTELNASIRCVRRAPWLHAVVGFWPNWTREPGFPASSSSRERLEWVIRRHCQESGNVRFYLSARDAACIAGTCFKQANNILHALVRDGVLARVGRRKVARHAQEFRLGHQRKCGG